MPTKAEIRRWMRARLDNIAAAEFQIWNEALTARLLRMERVLSATNVMLYYSIRNEAVTIAAIEELLRLGKTVSLPVCTPDRGLWAGIVGSLDELIPAKFGLLEPGPDSPRLDPSRLELVIVPGLAFDRRGNRIGHGAGYYDRFLKRADSAYKLGLGYDFQIIEEVPALPHDVRLDAVLTPTGLIEPVDGYSF